ncbi:MAG: hypothetical protein Hyperionvirus4_24 [Hyperionvirus sp.]|uniref:Uncharacterized protein n=1 Tax=Hyperionvirus sp. TaxID=2487770 RepID=A0A3G5ACJ0_9VIRU|nr:MAG: hypothetical protein Hyperionvirus4_24 [Hyperionvirus sp.]
MVMYRKSYKIKFFNWIRTSVWRQLLRDDNETSRLKLKKILIGKLFC